MAHVCGASDGIRTRDGRNHNPGLYQLSYARQCPLSPAGAPVMVRPAGLEPATAGLEGRCSIRLSYGRQTPARGAASSMVGAEGFEPPTLCSQSRCATRLRHAPPDGLSVATARGLPACARARILRRPPPPVNLPLCGRMPREGVELPVFFSDHSGKRTLNGCRFWAIQSRRDCSFSANGGWHR